MVANTTVWMTIQALPAIWFCWKHRMHAGRVVEVIIRPGSNMVCDTGRFPSGAV